MKREHQLRREYPDLLRDRGDAALLQLVAQLDRALAPQAEGLPAQLIVAIDRAAQEQAKRVVRDERRHRLLPALRLSQRVSTLAVALLVTLFLMGAGYVVLPSLKQLFARHTGAEAIVSRGLGREVNVARTVDGFTVSVKRVYADPNQIVIGLTVSGPPGRTFNHIMPWGELGAGPAPVARAPVVARAPILTDTRGREFAGGMGGEQGGVVGGTAAYLFTYDGTGLEHSGGEIAVQLKIGKLTAYERTGEGEFREVTLEGPFVFDLTIPVESGRLAELHQRVESRGVGVTLERVVTTPTGTRVSLRGTGPDADVRLTVDGSTYQLHPRDGEAAPTSWSPDSRWDYVTSTSLLGSRGEWTLTVGPGQRPYSPVEPAAAELAGGPWIFRFVVP